MFPLSRVTRRWRSASPAYTGVALLCAVMLASVAVNGGAPATDPRDRQAKATATDRPLVARVLDDVRQGRTPSADNPIAGVVTPIRPVKGSSLIRLGRLRIPAIRVDTSFYSGVTADVLTFGPGHWPGTALPGDLGNSVISGHRVTHTHPFLNLDRLRPGHRVRVDLANRTVTYAVTRTTIVAEAQYLRFVLRQPVSKSDRQLTLFACNPKYTRLERIIVQASAVGTSPRIGVMTRPAITA